MSSLYIHLQHQPMGKAKGRPSVAMKEAMAAYTATEEQRKVDLKILLNIISCMVTKYTFRHHNYLKF